MFELSKRNLTTGSNWNSLRRFRFLDQAREIMNSTTESNCSQVLDSHSFDDFKPTLAQCFILVFIGYLVAKFQLLTASDLRGVNAFVIYVGVPGIICMSLADADFRDFRWELLLGLFLSKLFVFCLVAGVAHIVTGNVGLAGLLAVFSVHSNDLPVGNPLMSSLYKDSKPEMMKYLFLMPAMTMITFVPLGTLMIETYKTRRSLEARSSKSQGSAIKWSSILSEKGASLFFAILMKSCPTILATLVGIVFNFSFGSKMPGVLHQPLKVLAATVPGCVLWALGFNMYRKERYLITSAVIPASILLFVKMFLTPILMHSITKVLANGEDTFKDLTDFGLLYGFVAPATAIFQAGQEFRKAFAAMSVTLITSSFMSFPVSYVIARFSQTSTCELDDYIPLLRDVLFWVACFSIFCDLFVLLSILLRNKYRTAPYTYVICIVITQIFTTCGIVVWCLQEDSQEDAVYYEMLLYFGGETFGLIWTGIIAFVLISVDRNPNLAHKTFTFSVCSAVIIGGIITSVMCLLVPYSDVKQVYVIGRAQSNFQFLQLVIITLIQGLAMLLVSYFLLSYSKRKQTSNSVEAPLKSQRGIDNPVFYMDIKNVAVTRFKIKRLSSMDLYSTLRDKEESNVYYQEMLDKGSGGSNMRPTWAFRVFSLLVMLLITIILKFVSNLYKLSHSKALEIMIPLEFMQSIMFVGQGLFMLLTFGIDVRTLSIGMIKWWRLLRYGKEQVFTTSIDAKSEDALFCNKFMTFYFPKCFKDIAKERQWKRDVYKNCFWGHQLVDWMIEEGVAQDDVEAEELGQKLLLGGVIGHVTGVHYFHDAPYLYCFDSNDKQLPNGSQRYPHKNAC